MIVRARRRSLNPQIAKVYVLQIGTDPILAFEAKSLNEARELAKEHWFLSDLSGLRSGGRLVWDGRLSLHVGPAEGEHLDEVRRRLTLLRGTADVPLIYLIQVD